MSTQPQTVIVQDKNGGGSAIIIVLIAFALLVVALGGDVQGAIAHLLKWLTGGAIDLASTTPAAKQQETNSNKKPPNKPTGGTPVKQSAKQQARSQQAAGKKLMPLFPQGGILGGMSGNPLADSLAGGMVPEVIPIVP